MITSGADSAVPSDPLSNGMEMQVYAISRPIPPDCLSTGCLKAGQNLVLDGSNSIERMFRKAMPMCVRMHDFCGNLAVAAAPCWIAP